MLEVSVGVVRSITSLTFTNEIKGMDLWKKTLFLACIIDPSSDVFGLGRVPKVAKGNGQGCCGKNGNGCKRTGRLEIES